MATPTLIYCAGGNKTLAEIAISAGFKYGSQLPDTVYFPIYFADQNWKKPDRHVYMQALEFHRPTVATVLDLEYHDQLSTVLSWAEEAARFVETIIIIPKAQGIIDKIPRSVAGSNIRLGYSVPTNFSGTEIPIWDFQGWPIHLLGGSPHSQMRLAAYLNVASVDGNMINKMAVRHCQYWTAGNATWAKNKYWPTLKEANDGNKLPVENAHHEAFRRSCHNILEAWHNET
jgi:hypothetical protein